MKNFLNSLEPVLRIVIAVAIVLAAYTGDVQLGIYLILLLIYFELNNIHNTIKGAAALDAHLLTIWIKDNLKENKDAT